MTPERAEQSSWDTEYRRGLRAALPLLLGVAPFGLIFGALATANGLNGYAAAAMSAFVYAGSAQFLAAGLYASHAAPITIIFATFIINLRHMLYAVTLAPYYKHVRHIVLLPLAFLTTDESFIITMDRARRACKPSHIPWFALGTSTVLYIGWQLSTWAGIAAGTYIHDPARLGLDFALPATFIAFLVPQLRSRPLLFCALVAGTTALLFHSLPLQGGLIVAVLAGVVAGILTDRRSNDDRISQAHRP